jgi:hypothetical protein
MSRWGYSEGNKSKVLMGDDWRISKMLVEHSLEEEAAGVTLRAW